MFSGLRAERPKRVSRTVQTLFRTGGNRLKQGFAPCNRLFWGSQPGGPENTFSTLLKHFWTFWLFWHLYQAGRIPNQGLKDVIQRILFLELVSTIKSFTSQLGHSLGIIFITTSEMSSFSGPCFCLWRRDLPSYLFSDLPRRPKARRKNASSTKRSPFLEKFGFKMSQRTIPAELFSKICHLNVKIKCVRN